MKVLLFDTETTGLIDNHSLKLDRQAEVIEFYGCLTDLATGEIEKEFSQLIKPRNPASEEITKITGITNEMLEGQPPFSKVAPSIKAFLESAPFIIAHNLSFDKEILDIEFERLQKTIAWPRGLCTVEQTLHLRGYRLSLQALYEYLFNEPFKDAHRAGADVKALLRITVELFRTGDI